MIKTEYLDNLTKKSKDISRNIKKLKLHELKYFTEINFVNCEKNNNILIYLKHKYPAAADIYIGYINYCNNIKLYIFSKINIQIYKIIKSAIYIKN